MLVVAAVRARADVSNQQAPTPGLDQLSLELCRIGEEIVDLPSLPLELAEKLLRLDAAIQRLGRLAVSGG